MFKKISQYIDQRKPLKYLIGVGIGAGIGFLYYYFVGCNTGTCPLTSKPYNSMLIGAIMGFIWVYSPKSATREH